MRRMYGYDAEEEIGSTAGYDGPATKSRLIGKQRRHAFERQDQDKLETGTHDYCPQKRC